MYIFCLACPKLFWTVNDETWYRACRQTNSFGGGFVRKVPFFSFFYKLNFFFLFFSNVFSLSRPFFLSGSIGSWRVHQNTQRRYVVFFRLFFFAENDSIVLNKVSILKVK